MKQKKNRSRGQVLVIFVLTLTVLLLFAGLALDAGVTYVSYGQLKRAVDAASVAAANEFKRNVGLDKITKAASEVLDLHNIDMTQVDLHVYKCIADEAHSLARDESLAGTIPAFYNLCPATTDQPNSPAPRKLVWVDAKMRSPLYFLSIVGFTDVTLQANAVSEAAPIDLIIVLDTSESMATECADASCTGYKSPGLTQANLNYYNPNDVGNCNVVDYTTLSTDSDPNMVYQGSCQPLLQAKQAAISLIDQALYDNYDRAAVFTFDSVAHQIQSLTPDMTLAKEKVREITLHDDLPVQYIWPNWRTNSDGSQAKRFNPVFPDDRDGDGHDADDDVGLMGYGFDCDSPAIAPLWEDDHWVSQDEYLGTIPSRYDDWGGVPCDRDDVIDAYDMVNDNVYTSADTDAITGPSGWWSQPGYGDAGALPNSLSTCTGCGIKAASDHFKMYGRPTSVWVMVFLSDGFANLSARPNVVPISYPLGFCSGSLNENNNLMGFWPTVCIDNSDWPRYCIDAPDDKTCPPTEVGKEVIWEASPSPRYSALDWARDMVDEAALRVSSGNANEPRGNDMAIYTIALKTAAGGGERLLRYMAAVGDDGDRRTDPCATAPDRTSCGNYYFAPDSRGLLAIFEDIAGRIYTRITN